MKIKDFMEKEGYSFYTDDTGGFRVEKGGKEVEPKDVLLDKDVIVKTNGGWDYVWLQRRGWKRKTKKY